MKPNRSPGTAICGLPARPDDLMKFIVLSQEKLKAVRAEIRAIQRLDLAQEVLTQKAEELSRLQELAVLAQMRMGEITRELPKARAGRPSKAAHGTDCQRSKAQTIRELGLSKAQVHRMELLAAHPDIVEEVIAESQAGQTDATQVEVLRRIKEQNAPQGADTGKAGQDDANIKLFRRAIRFWGIYQINDQVLDSVAANDMSTALANVNTSIQLLLEIRNKLLEKGQISPEHFEEICTSHGFTLPKEIEQELADMESVLPFAAE